MKPRHVREVVDHRIPILFDHKPDTIRKYDTQDLHGVCCLEPRNVECVGTVDVADVYRESFRQVQLRAGCELEPREERFRLVYPICTA